MVSTGRCWSQRTLGAKSVTGATTKSSTCSSCWRQQTPTIPTCWSSCGTGRCSVFRIFRIACSLMLNRRHSPSGRSVLIKRRISVRTIANSASEATDCAYATPMACQSLQHWAKSWPSFCWPKQARWCQVAAYGCIPSARNGTTPTMHWWATACPWSPWRICGAFWPSCRSSLACIRASHYRSPPCAHCRTLRHMCDRLPCRLWTMQTGGESSWTPVAQSWTLGANRLMVIAPRIR